MSGPRYAVRTTRVSSTAQRVSACLLSLPLYTNPATLAFTNHNTYTYNLALSRSSYSDSPFPTIHLKLYHSFKHPSPLPRQALDSSLVPTRPRKMGLPLHSQSHLQRPRLPIFQNRFGRPARPLPALEKLTSKFRGGGAGCVACRTTK